MLLQLCNVKYNSPLYSKKMKKSIVFFTILAFTTFAFLTSCKNKETKIEDDQEDIMDAKKDLIEVKHDSTDYESFKIKINEQIAANELEIADLKDKAIDKSKNRYNKTIISLEEKNIALKTKINGYYESSKEGWELFKNDINKTEDDLEKEFNDLKSKK